MIFVASEVERGPVERRHDGPQGKMDFEMTWQRRYMAYLSIGYNKRSIRRGCSGEIASYQRRDTCKQKMNVESVGSINTEVSAY